MYTQKLHVMHTLSDAKQDAMKDMVLSYADKLVDTLAPDEQADINLVNDFKASMEMLKSNTTNIVNFSA